MKRLSKSAGSGGDIKCSADDFIVEEIQKDNVVLELGRTYSNIELGMDANPKGKFTVFVMQKNCWNTTQALKAIAKRCGRGFRSVGFAGTKDRVSVSTQLCSVFGATPEILGSLHMKDLIVNGAWASDAGISLGDLLGNRFTIVVRDPDDYDAVSSINDELEGVFPNYFGEQRFGFRDNNVSVGTSILKGDFEAAVMEFLTGTKNEHNEAAIEARERLGKERDFFEALDYFPEYLKYERSMLERLSQYPTDYTNALRKLPRQLLLMFVHSIEAQLFNAELESRVAEGDIAPRGGDNACLTDRFGFPDINKVVTAKDADGKKCFGLGSIVGFETGKLTDSETDMLEKLGLSKEQFKVKRMPELSMKGSYRVLFAPYTGFSSFIEDSAIKMQFSLPAGSYATVLLNEFVS